MEEKMSVFEQLNAINVNSNVFMINKFILLKC